MADYAPDALVRAGKEAAKEIPSAKFSGVLGDRNHTYGYHRGRNVLPKNDYSVTLSLDKQGPAGAASALDISLSAAQMKVVTKRLRDAALDPNDTAMEAVREFYGTLDGKKVFGLIHDSEQGYWRNSTSDSSHLWHIHISFFRKYANNYAAVRKVIDVMKGVKASKPPVATTPVSSTKPAAKPTTYTVKKGDTLVKISRSVGVPVDTLVKINAISNKNLIRVGQVLKLVGSATAPAKPKFQMGPWKLGPNDYFKPYLNSVPPVYWHVQQAQKKLKELGYLKGAVDGQFGRDTRSAVIAFQKKERLVADGLLGPITYNRLRSK
jgi:LysM repeat protein